MPITLDNALKLQHIKSHGLDKNIGYKIIASKETIFFLRWLDGSWRETIERIPFSALNAINYLESVLISGRQCELFFFGCCCHDCRGADIIASEMKVRESKLLVSHGFWPEHVEREIQRCENEMMNELPKAYKAPKVEIPKQKL